MTKKIFHSIITATLISVMASILLILFVLYGYFGSVQKSQLQTELNLVQSAMELNGTSYLESLHDEEERFTLIGADGTVLYDTKANAKTMENHADRKEVLEAREKGYGESSRYSSTLMHETLYYAKKLPNQDVIRVSQNRVTMLALLIKMIQPILLIAILTFVLALILAKKMAQKIVQPLNALDLNHPLRQKTYDELNPLLLHIEAQKGQIQTQKQQLEEQKNEFYHVIQDMKEGLVLFNDKQEVLSMNPYATRVLEIDDLMNSFTLKDLKLNPQVEEFIISAYDAREKQMLLEKEKRIYQLYANQIKENNTLLGVVILILDVTDKVMAEKNRREFTANVSHELKTPLHAIMGRAELLEDQLVKPEDIPVFAKEIHNKANSLLEMVEKLIGLSKLDENIKPTEEMVHLDHLVKEEIDNLETMAAQKDVKLIRNLHPVTCLCAPTLWKEIVKNLVENAIKYNKQGGHVEISFQEKDHQICFVVKDTGIGIPFEEQSRIFERFYQVNKAYDEIHHGSGLGLSIVKHAVDDLGGSIEVESKTGSGTKISVFVPQYHTPTIA